jgi:YidC/Oxa1 family membrane protein insertase
MFNTLFYQPLYNALVFLSSIVPGYNIGVAIILLTIIVRLVLFPLYEKSIETQFKMKKIEPELKRIKEKYSDKQEQTKQILELYKINKLNPFSGFVVLLIQIPIILALFWVFRAGFVFDPKILYSFISAPIAVNTSFFGILLTTPNLILAILTGVTQFVQTQIALPKTPPKNPNETKPASFQDDLARSMNMQMKYVMPIIIIFIARSLSAAISLYWITSNLFSIGQDLYVKRKLKLSN